MPEVPILYNLGEVAGLADNVGSSAQTLMSLHDEVKNQTDAVAEFFTGTAATAFRENQLMMLSGLQDLIDVMSNHGHAISSAGWSANSTDHQMAQGFQM
jgi:WXG100 family type VII secretion target